MTRVVVEKMNLCLFLFVFQYGDLSRFITVVNVFACVT
jgi:hypothetical protein